MQNTLDRAMVAGMVATAGLSLATLAAPLLGLPRVNVAWMLADWLGGPLLLGWAMQFLIGTTLGVIYAALFAAHLHGPGPLRGALFSLLPWAAAQFAVLPVMGMGLYPASTGTAGTTLLGLLVFGAIVGTICPAARHDHSRVQRIPARIAARSAHRLRETIISPR